MPCISTCEPPQEPEPFINNTDSDLYQRRWECSQFFSFIKYFPYP